jgi:hypothetical protein
MDETSPLTPTCKRREPGANSPMCQIVRFVGLACLFRVLRRDFQPRPKKPPKIENARDRSLWRFNLDHS